MLMHSCWSIVFNMLSGFDLNSKRSKNHLEMELENLFGKRKGNTFLPLPSSFWPPAQLSPLAQLPLPLALLSPVPAQPRATQQGAGLAPHAQLLPRLHPVPQPLTAWARLPAPSPTSRAPRQSNSNRPRPLASSWEHLPSARPL